MKKKKLLVPILAVAIMVTCSMTAHGRGFGQGHDKHGAWARFSGMRLLIELNFPEDSKRECQMIPENPINAIARIPAVIRAAGMPFM